MRLTRAGDYALRGMLYMASLPSGQVVTLQEISEKKDVPRGFLAKIFQTLTRAGLVRSFPGVGGGFVLARPARLISMLDIVEAVEGPIFLNRCLIRKGECQFVGTCSAHPVWKKAQGKLTEVLRGADLESLAHDSGGREGRR